MNQQQVLNTPGYFYAVGYALSIIVICLMQRPKLPAWRLVTQSLGLFVGLIAFMMLTTGATGLYYVACVAFIIGFIYLNIRLMIRDRCLAGFLCVKAFIYGEFAASLCWQLYYFMAQRWDALWAWRWRLPIMLGIFAALMLILFFMERKLRQDGLELRIDTRELLIALLTASGIYVMSNLSYLNPGGLFSGSFNRDIFTIRTLVDLSGVTLIYAFHLQLNELQLRLEKDALHHIMLSQYQAYQMTRENIDMVNEKYHDLKHQIALLKSQAGSKKSEAYLNQLEREIRVYETQNQTGNPVLDAILTNKAVYCQRNGIELKFITDGKLLSFMDDMEISALFGNMLDNAIESVERIPDPQKRLIRLYIDREKQFLRIRMENYCETPVRFNGGVPVSSKGDARYHGFGFKSMQKTVARYGGSLLAEQNNNWFELKILIPLEAQ